MFFLTYLLFLMNLIAILIAFLMGKTLFFWIGISIPFLILEGILGVIDFYQNKNLCLP